MSLDLKELQNAHYELLERYVEALDKFNTLPWLIKIDHVYEVEQTGKQGTNRLSRFIHWVRDGLYSLTYWKPILQYSTEAHIKRRIVEIRTAYQHFSLSLSPSKRGSKQIQAWMEKAIPNLKEFEGTLQSRQSLLKTFKSIGTPLAAIIAAIVGVNSFTDLIPKFVQWFNEAGELRVTYTLGLVAFVMLLYYVISLPFMNSYDAKYKLLRSKDIEERLFEALGRHKVKEFSVDGILLNVMVIGSLAAILLINYLLTNNGLDPLFSPSGKIIAIVISAIFLLVINI